ncbi:hypothetical protein SAMN04488063_1900 [Halopelagius inordinatus]|uniref:Uncharacterized protein n=1 Tax=Halopelagius inordinatus TaxID=553467 RepID=A0A1I2RF23_9EURY|nr:hypothetical protein [Halopelagius inordinatus]SFG39305.1 hypothetical protein SAMN04488063_1900 [Halopelagius inordinatus]
MDDSTLQNRRRFLEGVTVGGGVLLAGCTDQFGGDTQDNVQEGTETGGGANGGANSAAAIAAVDQQAMREEQAAIREEVQSGEMNQTEAREEMSSVQQKYVGEAMDSLTATVEETDGVSAGQTYDEFGVVTVEGGAGAILGILDSDDVNALVSIADVEEQIQGQGTTTTESGA